MRPASGTAQNATCGRLRPDPTPTVRAAACGRGKGRDEPPRTFNGDAVEFEKALRIVEKRRGDLLGDPMPGSRTDLSPVTRALEVAESPMTVSRWRTIAAHWDELWPLVRDATDKRDLYSLLSAGLHTIREEQQSDTL